MFARLLTILGAAAGLAACMTTQPAPTSASIPLDQQAFLDTCKPWDEWSKPAPPFRIYANSYYVGTCGLASILITGSEGHILIDGASRDGGPLVEASIDALGFDVNDIALISHSHEHYDHVGGLAYLQERSGARIVASKGASNALQTGETQPGDPQFGMHDSFAPARVDKEIGDGEVVAVGKIALIAMETPGHTPGALTWSWWSCFRTECKLLVYMDSLSPISRDDYRFSDHPEYLAKYRAGLARLAQTPCDIALTPHPSASSMLERMAIKDGLVDKGYCKTYARQISERLESRISREADGE